MLTRAAICWTDEPHMPGSARVAALYEGLAFGTVLETTHAAEISLPQPSARATQTSRVGSELSGVAGSRRSRGGCSDSQALPGTAVGALSELDSGDFGRFGHQCPPEA